MFKADAPVHANAASRLLQVGKLKVREDVAFADKNGKEKRGKRKAAEKALAKLQVPLEKFVAEGETVLFIAPVRAPISPLEQWTFGWYVYNVCATVLVITERRLLHLRVASNLKWLEIISECSWSDIQEVKSKGWLSPTCEFTFKNGKKARYWGLKRRDSTVLAKLVPLLLQGSLVDAAPGTFMTSLCPECCSKLTVGVFQCSSCQLLFKNEKTLLKLIFLPGAAHFYCRQWFLGAVDVLAEGYLVIAFFGATMLLTEGIQKGGDTLTSALTVFGIISVLLSIDALISYAHGRRFIREFISTGKKAEGAKLMSKMAAGGTIG